MKLNLKNISTATAGVIFSAMQERVVDLNRMIEHSEKRNQHEWADAFKTERLAIKIALGHIEDALREEADNNSP